MSKRERQWETGAQGEATPPALITEAEAVAIVGKRVLVGLTYVDADQNPLRLVQHHGVIVRANRKEGIVMKLKNGDEFALPPVFQYLKQAPPGEYRLRSTGEIVMDPDFTVTFTVNQQH
jgi:hypothetical protein